MTTNNIQFDDGYHSGTIAEILALANASDIILNQASAPTPESASTFAANVASQSPANNWDAKLLQNMVSGFLVYYTRDNPTNFTSWSDFSSALSEYLRSSLNFVADDTELGLPTSGADVGAAGTVYTRLNSTQYLQVATLIKNQFVDIYLNSMGSSLNRSTNPPTISGDWSVLQPFINNGSIDFNSNDPLKNPFIASFSQFMSGFNEGTFAANYNLTNAANTLGFNEINYTEDAPFIGIVTGVTYYNPLVGLLSAPPGTSDGLYGLSKNGYDPTTLTYSFGSTFTGTGTLTASIGNVPWARDLSAYGGGVFETTALDNFIQAYSNSLTNVVASIKPGTGNLSAVSGQTINGISGGIQSYQFIYFATHPATATANINGTPAQQAAALANFQAAMTSFVQGQITATGTFLPSSSFRAFVLTNINEAIPPLIGQSSLDGNDSYKVIILNKILLLLIKLITSIQNMGIAQSQRLTFTTQYQQAYTLLQTQIPVFIKGGQGYPGISGGDDDQATARQELNTSVNGFLQQNLRNLGGLQDSAAKKQQSNLNQTNDAVNQQSDICSTLIQQLTSLLSSILR